MPLQLVTHVRNDHPRKRALEAAVQQALEDMAVSEAEGQVVLGDERPGVDGFGASDRVRIAVLLPTSVRFGIVGSATDAAAVGDLLRRLLTR